MSAQFTLFFDAKDHELLQAINNFLERDSHTPEQDARRFFHRALHPHGINELALSQEFRVAYAVINLLDSLEAGQAHDRISALRILHNEVLYFASSSFRYNTGRVLIQLMKNLVRAHGNYDQQLRLAHDFRKAAGGNRRIIRQMLKQFFLLEMPEEWNQISFDFHVHDANTKGRKSPTHLIMDAWIKGIRSLSVLYYNYVEPSAAEELMQAAEIMGITVNIGVEFQVKFHGRYVQFIWEPTGFADYRDMLAFLEERPIQHLMRMGREASLHHHNYVISLLHHVNQHMRHEIGAAYGVVLEEIHEEEILGVVRRGQTSRTHLAELIYKKIIDAFSSNFPDIRERHASATPEEREQLQKQINAINALTPDYVMDTWLSSKKSGHVSLVDFISADGKVPEIMQLSPEGLMDWLSSVHGTCRIVLNLSDLSAADVLELLYICTGMITHLELYNLKNFMGGHMDAMESICSLQSAVNEGSIIALKRLIRNIIKEFGCSLEPDAENRCAVFSEILRNIPKLQAFYAIHPLQARVGSDSTSKSARIHGMGFVFPETLPRRAQKMISHDNSQRSIIPLHQEVYPSIVYYPKNRTHAVQKFTEFVRLLPGCRRFGLHSEEIWTLNSKRVEYTPNGNITTLGGFQREAHQAFSLQQEEKKPISSHSFAHLNTTVKNILKVTFGFALTLATFLYTQDWWALAWFGPVVWFGITGYRNILQATLGGGGIRRTPLLGWRAYLSWSRLCDSLMFTGISVPLLELGVRWLFLEKTLNLTSVDQPLLFFSIISAVNGCYIAAHNMYRGLPQEAVIGNLLRSVLAIPLSIAYSFVIYEVFYLAGWDIHVLQQSAAVISKLASDSVAAMIEGFADKVEFLRRRYWDYRAKLEQLFGCYSRLELLLPEEDVLELLQRPKDFIKTVGKEAEDLEKTIIINALDLMYFWMYQPRARSTLARLLPKMTQEEREIFMHSQYVLTRVHEVSQLFVDGLVGRNFARPLAFYLAKHEEYLADMAKITGITPQVT